MRGGELLLTTGHGFGDDSKAQRRFATQLSERDVAALVLELGQVFTDVPGTLAREAREAGLTMIVLHREVPFVETTEAINRGLMDSRLVDVKHADELQRQFTGLMLEGGGIPEVLGALAASIATFATHLVDPRLPHPAELLSRIGHKHASLGVTADQYAIVHEHLFAAIVEVLGADTVTADVAAAWDRVSAYSGVVGGYTFTYRGWGGRYDSCVVTDRADGFTAEYSLQRSPTGTLTVTASPAS